MRSVVDQLTQSGCVGCDVIVFGRLWLDSVGRKLCMLVATAENSLDGMTLTGAPVATGLPAGPGPCPLHSHTGIYMGR